MEMEPLMVSVGDLVSLYAIVHVIFGLVTHYHSVAEIRAYNKRRLSIRTDNSVIGPIPVAFLFAMRVAVGLPWFIGKRIIAPVGSPWHMSPEQIAGA